MIIQNKVCIPQADTELQYIITSHNTYRITDTYVFTDRLHAA